jgi:hypothetical protein
MEKPPVGWLGGTEGQRNLKFYHYMFLGMPCCQLRTTALHLAWLWALKKG